MMKKIPEYMLVNISNIFVPAKVVSYFGISYELEIDFIFKTRDFWPSYSKEIQPITEAQYKLLTSSLKSYKELVESIKK